MCRILGGSGMSRRVTALLRSNAYVASFAVALKFLVVFVTAAAVADYVADSMTEGDDVSHRLF